MNKTVAMLIATLVLGASAPSIAASRGAPPTGKRGAAAAKRIGAKRVVAKLVAPTPEPSRLLHFFSYYPIESSSRVIRGKELIEYDRMSAILDDMHSHRY